MALRLRQGAERAQRMDAAVSGRFLTGEERAQAIHQAREMGVAASFDGGWPGAERVQVCFHPLWTEAEFTGVWLEIRWAAKFARVGHSDLLGSLMALGMERSFFGDLIALEDRAYLVALPEAAARLPLEWEKAGNIPLKIAVLLEAPSIEMPHGEEMRDTVASLRLDSLLASGMRTSRTRAAEMIRAGVVMVEHVPEERIDRVVDVGQVLSIRGFGRIRLVQVGDRTRKDRLPVTLEIFQRNK